MTVFRAWLMPWRAVAEIRRQQECVRFMIRAFDAVADQLEFVPVIPPRRRDHLRLVK